MTHLRTLIIATTAIISVAGNASATEPTFQAVFTFDKTASVYAQYTSFQEAAKTTCEAEIRKAGFRGTQPTSWVQRKCVRDLVEQAVRTTKSKALLALHNSADPTIITTRQYANR